MESQGSHKKLLGDKRLPNEVGINILTLVTGSTALIQMFMMFMDMISIITKIYAGPKQLSALYAACAQLGALPLAVVEKGGSAECMHCVGAACKNSPRMAPTKLILTTRVRKISLLDSFSTCQSQPPHVFVGRC